MESLQPLLDIQGFLSVQYAYKGTFKMNYCPLILKLVPKQTC